MEERKCVICHVRAVAFRCIQCHKAICNECAFKTENGAFCSRECAGAYREFQRNHGGSARKGAGGALKAVIVVIILLAAAAFAAYKLGLISPDQVEQLKAKVSNVAQ